MNRNNRKTVIVGNWKMHKTVSEAKVFLETLKTSLPQSKRCIVAVCVPYVAIPAAVKDLKKSRIAVGAQNLHWEEEGAYTGEISASMLAELDVKYVIVGHSERRAMFGETDLMINHKLRAALDAGMHPILCVGEDRVQRKLGVSQEHIAVQMKAALAGITPEEMRRVVLAYEPVWAMELETAIAQEQAGQACADIRGMVRNLYGPRIARSTTILYGGPMDETNASTVLSQEDVDGGLIGPASLSARRFLEIIQAAIEE